MAAQATGFMVFDTNVVLHLDDGAGRVSSEGRAAAEVHRAAQKLGYLVGISDVTLEELRGSKSRPEERLRAAERYPVLSADPLGDLASRGRFPAPMGLHDARDLEILALADQKKCSWIVTEDDNLIKRAENAGITTVVSLSRMREYLEPIVSPRAPLPMVNAVPPQDVDMDGEYFDSLEASYPGFFSWWKDKVVAEERTTLIVGNPSDLEGLAVIKERDNSHDLPQTTSKLCTFKVADGYRRGARGELLLRAVIEHVRASGATHLFVEVHPQNKLIGWLEEFGFSVLSDVHGANGDAVLLKRLRSLRKDVRLLDPLAYNVRFGPGALKIRNLFRVPIRTAWRQILFPRASDQAGTIPGLEGVGQRACGRAIRKVYLCHAPIRSLSPGDTVAFVESGTGREIQEFGVVEQTLVSDDPVELIRFAGSRTVYSADQIRQMAKHSEVLAVKLRHDRTLALPLSPATDGYTAAFTGSAQSITKASKEAVKWVCQQLPAQC